MGDQLAGKMAVSWAGMSVILWAALKVVKLEVLTAAMKEIFLDYETAAQLVNEWVNQKAEKMVNARAALTADRMEY